MERHKCKLCMRTFSNGNALGGHIRSHMMNHPMIPQDQTDSFSEDEDDHGDLYASGSVLDLQDRESETESCKNPTRRRSKRTRKSAIFDHHLHYPKPSQHDHHQEAFKKMKLRNKIDSCSNNNAEPEPMSSISDATTEENVAFCLMMLSRGKWRTQDKQQEEPDDHEDEEDVGVGYRSFESDDESEKEQVIKFKRSKSARGKYKCDTCDRVFKSYQALGGHRASHKKMKASAAANNMNPNRVVYEAEAGEEIYHNAGGSSFVKTHECPVCFRVFSSGQALGGHKRSHVTGSAAINNTQSMISLAKLGDSMIDLNLPAPADDDEIEMSQIELSAVSDAEFANPIRR